MTDFHRRSLTLLLALFALASTACSSMTKPAEGPPGAGPKEGEARVYFALNQGYPPGAAYIVEETKLLGYLENNEHFVVDVPAGEHMFMLISEQDEAMAGQFEAGKTYYVKLFVTPGIMSTRVYWVPLKTMGEDRVTAKEMLEETERVELVSEEAAEWEADERDDLAERAKSFRTGEDEIEHKVGPEHAY